MAYVYEQIKELYVNNLHHDVIQTVRFFNISINRIKQRFGIADGLNVVYFYASSLYHVKEYKLSAQTFQNFFTYYAEHSAIFQKDLNKTSIKRKNSSEDNIENVHQTATLFCPLNEIKYRMHLCYKELGQFGSAIKALQTIPKEGMSLKILTSLGDLFMETHRPEEGLDCYMLAIKKNPLALNTINKFLSYASFEIAEEFVQQLCTTVGDNFPPNDIDPLCNYIRAHNLARLPKNFKTACQMFFNLRSTNKNVQVNGPFFLPEAISDTDNIYMLLETSKYLYYDGFITNANFFYKMIYSDNPDLLEGVDCYAACLYRDSRFKNLQCLTNHVISLCSSTDATRKIAIRNQSDKPTLIDIDANNLMFNRPEPWIVIGYYNLAKKDPKTILFANKALLIDPNCEEALILKTLIYSRKVGEVLGLLKCHREFIDEIEQFIFKTKHKRLYVRFEILKYMAEAILIKDGRDTAEHYVKQAIERYGMTPRICAFYSNLIYMDKNSAQTDRTTANKLLEDAVRLNPYYLSAVLNLSKIYMDDGNYDKAVPILSKAVEKFDYSFIHKMIIECYTKLGQEEKAVMHQTKCASRTMVETPPVTAQKIKEENLNEGIIELDLTALSSINPTGDNTELADFADIPPEFEMDREESSAQQMETH